MREVPDPHMPYMPISRVTDYSEDRQGQQQEQLGAARRGQLETTIFPWAWSRENRIRSTSFAFIGTIRILDKCLPDWWLIRQSHFI
jgi:hypothetical protein